MKKNTLFFIFFCCSFLTVAQNQYKFNRFTTDDGLTTNSIYAISENKNGTIILGTDNGLTFFDGNNFKTFNVKDGLINPFIVSVYTDKDNVVWFINYAGKLQKFENNKIVTTPVFTNHANSIITTKNEVFLYTSQNRYANNTYLYLKINKNNWIIKEPQKYASEINKIAPPILVQNEQQIRFENNYLLFKNLKVAVPKEVSLLHKVIFRKADVLLIDENYLFVLNYHKKEFAKISLPCAISKNHIYKFDFVTDKQNNCWLNIQNKGLFILQNNKWVAVNKNLGLNATDNINFLFCDSTGKMWIATNEKGLFCIASTAISYYQFANENNYFNGFATAIEGKSLFISSKFCLYTYKNNELRFLKKSDSEIKIDNYHNIPVFFTPAKKVTQWYPKLNMLIASGKQLLKYNTGTSITLNGANAINYNQTQVVSHQNEKIKNVVIHKNKYYFNNSDKISVRIFNEKEFTIQRELRLNIKGYIQDFIFIKDTLWIATEGKVYKAFNEKIVDSISTINNFAVENVNKIKVYNDVVFLCSSKGLFAVKNKCNRVLNQFNYLPGNEVYNATIFNNELLVATKEGLAKIKTILAFTATQKPKLQLVYNNNVTAQINMGAKQEAVKIELQIQNFYSVKNQIIQYKIDNLKWINTENKVLNFQSLAYGKHVVLVRVKDVNSMWAAKKIVVYKAYPFYLKWWFIALAAVLFLVIIILIYKNQVNKINVKKQLEIGTNNRLIELRQSALSAMMNPHFVYNALNAIQYFVNSNQIDKSSEHLAKLARLVRLFLSQAEAPFISLDQEIARLKLYVELEQMRFENFKFEITIDADINLINSKIPNMIVQPFIENAILHGISHLTTKDGRVELNLHINQNILTIEVVDNGFGMNRNTSKNDTHISKGIAIITERIEILQQSYPEKVFTIQQKSAFSDKDRKGHKVIIKVTI